MSYREIFCKAMGLSATLCIAWWSLDFALAAYEERNSRLLEELRMEAEARWDMLEGHVNAIKAMTELFEVGRAPRERGESMPFEQAELAIIANVVRSLKMAE